ncbi:hypothetical protein C9374_004805 [Naegleria lovaniensis]|uniref:Uncharacterized protein n=1 Tax=Naegleria lovaniensis TaxID=51637 RepID=A0AA88GQU3_NAELO|nr:uncharacterized protein C9374_004805 [Naegleria lovaniensis]KAG2382838.1 hypothetical protein C9374_004805 [Naegleria lovaniensis]
MTSAENLELKKEEANESSQPPTRTMQVSTSIHRDDTNEIALFGNSHHLDDEPEVVVAFSSSPPNNTYSSSAQSFLTRQDHHQQWVDMNSDHNHQHEPIGTYSALEMKQYLESSTFQKGTTDELEGGTTTTTLWHKSMDIQKTQIAVVEECKVVASKSIPSNSKKQFVVKFNKHAVFIIGKRNCAILLTCVPLCMCWVLVMSVIIYCMASLFVYWANMPYDPKMKCSALYQSQHDLFVPKIVTMDDLDLDKEKTHFITSQDFLNSSLSSHQQFLQNENAPYNQLSRLMTHNSYHRKKMFFSSLISQFNYEHDEIETQLQNHVRGLELDVHFNKRTGRFQVYHIPVLDDHSSCDCFLSCLLLIKRWMKREEENSAATRSISNSRAQSTSSNNHPILPDILTIYIEPKYSRDVYQFCGENVPSVFPDLINEILRVFPLHRILTPAKLKGNYTTVREAINDRGWPLRDSIRGMVMFVVNLWDENKDCTAKIRTEGSKINPTDILFYRDGFKNMQQPNNDAIFFEIDDARPFMNLTSYKPMLSDGEAIDTLVLKDEKFVIPSIISRNVQKGLIIRCTTGGPKELTGKAIRQQSSKVNTKYSSFTQSEACMRSGAQLINTDYPNSAIFKTLFANETFLNPLFYDMNAR